MNIGKEHLQSIAQTILDQLNMRKREVWAWGSKNFYCIERKVDDQIHPALQFSIKTPRVQRGGRVIISLNQASDEYIVESVRVVNGEEKPLGKQVGVHCGELHNVINSFIEHEGAYRIF